MCGGIQVLKKLHPQISKSTSTSWWDTRFARPLPHLSMICKETIHWLESRWGFILIDLNQQWLTPQNLMSFANSIYQKGTALDNIWGFVDSTLRGIARPVPNQGVTYNRHKRKHGLKYQSITTPNGIISNLFGPVEGRCHDSSMLAMSVMMPVLENFSIGPNGERLCIHGDPAYPLRWYLQGPFRGAQINPDQCFKFKKSMSKLHVSVEWLFGNVIENFKYSDY